MMCFCPDKLRIDRHSQNKLLHQLRVMGDNYHLIKYDLLNFFSRWPNAAGEKQRTKQLIKEAAGQKKSLMW